MTRTKELEIKIKNCKTHEELKTLWNTRKNENGEDVWPKGKLMEFLIAKAFELESLNDKPVFVTYPYGVREEQRHNYIAVFDSDSDNESVRLDRISMVKYLSRADYHSNNIGVFCFRNSLEKELGLPKLSKIERPKLVDVLKTRKSEMRKCRTIIEIQEFIDQLR